LPTPCFAPPTTRAMCHAARHTTCHAAGYWACAQNVRIRVRCCQRWARHWLVWAAWHHCRPKKKRKEKKRKEYHCTWVDMSCHVVSHHCWCQCTPVEEIGTCTHNLSVKNTNKWLTYHWADTDRTMRERMSGEKVKAARSGGTQPMWLCNTSGSKGVTRNRKWRESGQKERSQWC